MLTGGTKVVLSALVLFVCLVCTLSTAGVAVRARPSSIPQLSSEAKSVDELLSIADVIKLSGEEQLHWEHQDVHRLKRQRGCGMALRRLARMTVGVNMADERRRITSNSRFERLVVGACSLKGAGAADDVSEVLDSAESLVNYCDVLNSAALIYHNSGKQVPPPSLVNLVTRIDSALGTQSVAEMGVEESVFDSLCTSVQRLGLHKVGPRIILKRSSLNLPFALLPGMVLGEISLAQVKAEVAFRAEKIVTKDKTTVLERRKTSWMADDGIGGLAYSGKIMSPVAMTPSIRKVRDAIYNKTNQFFDCCLVNLYDDGDCACAWHHDPDLGTVFARDSVIVSVGESRRFALRRSLSSSSSSSSSSSKPKAVDEADHHVHAVHDGDVFHMTGSCQEDFQHAVLKSEGPHNDAPRASIVFKRTVPGVNGKRGHGIPKPSRENKPVESSPPRGVPKPIPKSKPMSKSKSKPHHKK